MKKIKIKPLDAHIIFPWIPEGMMAIKVVELAGSGDATSYPTNIGDSALESQMAKKSRKTRKKRHKVVASKG